MNHFTHEKSSASEECLHFIRAFARFYLPEKDNEEEARQWRVDLLKMQLLRTAEILKSSKLF